MKKTKTKLQPTKSNRLPDSIKPEHYWLSFSPDFSSLSFSGKEIVTVEIKKTTDTVTMHSKDLQVSTAVITNGTDEQICNVSYNKTDELLYLKTKHELTPGVYNIELDFQGKLNKNMRGLYHSSYLLKGKTEHIAVTQFEPTDARRAFPCFDEPAQKASFSLELLVPPGMEAISNTVVTSKTRQRNGLYKVSFAPSPVMSTYLLAFVVGNFEFIEDLSEDGVTVRVFTTPGKKAQAEFALETAKGVLDFFNNYFKIKYPLPTLDMIAIPDFAAGAMENWGAITYRETAILVDPKNTSTLAKQWVALVIAHELAHQWFGNLVTMKWWTHLWLNEGFASYISYLAVDHLFPKWNMWSQFINSDLTPALELDSLKNTHPIQVEVNHPNEINEIFDEVSYAKGASVLRMLADYLGPVKFRDGLRHYLRTYQYSNAATEDLWKSFEKVSNKPVRKIMCVWTETDGYPVVSVAKTKNKLVLEQKRFFADPKQKANPKQIWSIPIRLKTGKSNSQLLLNKKKLVAALPKSNFIKLNSGEVGLYRTKYDPILLRELLGAVGQQKLHTADRLGLLRDMLALAKAGSQSSDKVLEALSAYKTEQKYTVWVQIGSALGQINHLYKHDKLNSKLKAFSKEIFSPIAEQVGWETKAGEDASRSLLRTFALYRAGHYGNDQIIEKAQQLFADYIHKKKTIPADLRAVVYNLVAQNGKPADFEAMLAKYRQETLVEEKNRLARAMALFPNEKLLKKFLQFCISKDVRSQDTPLLIGAAWGNSIAKEQIWEFLKGNWAQIVKRYGDGGHLLVRFIEPTGNFTTVKQAQKVQSFFKKNKAPGAERTVSQAIEEIQIHANWAEKDRKKVEKFLLNWEKGQ